MPAPGGALGQRSLLIISGRESDGENLAQASLSSSRCPPWQRRVLVRAKGHRAGPAVKLWPWRVFLPLTKSTGCRLLPSRVEGVKDSHSAGRKHSREMLRANCWAGCQKAASRLGWRERSRTDRGDLPPSLLLNSPSSPQPDCSCGCSSVELPSSRSER